MANIEKPPEANVGDLSASNLLLTSRSGVRFDVPLVTISANNSREHWAVKAKRVKAERSRVAYAIKKARAECPGPLLTVRLTRVSPRTLDQADNLPGSMKSVVDQVACFLGIDDRSRLVRWEYAQEKGEPAVRVEIEQIA